jgi:lysophospholipase L1-like esterase
VTFRTLVALGDSMTEGRGDATDDMPCRSWVDAFVEQMQRDHHASFRAVNLATHGKKLRDVVAEQLEPALLHAPDLVSVMVGGNDLRRTRRWQPEGFEHDLRGLLTRLAAACQPVVLLATVPDFALALPFSSFDIKREMQRLIRTANAVITRVGHELGAVLVDLHSHPATYDLDNYSQDFMHPNARGHALIAARVFEVLQAAHGPRLRAGDVNGGT